MRARIEPRDVLHDGQEQRRQREDREQAAELADHFLRHQLGARLAAHHDQHEHGEGEAVEEGRGDEQGRHDRGIVEFARDQEAEDRAGAGRENEAPGEGEPADRLSERGVLRGAPIHHCEEVGRHDRHETRVEIDVPGEDRFEIVLQDRDDQPFRSAEIKHEHGQPARQQRDGENARESRIGLVGQPVEHRRDRGDIERARRRDDQEHREDMRQAPDDLVVHAGDDMAVLFHVERGAEAQRDKNDMQADQRPEAGAGLVERLEFYLGHRCPPVRDCDNARPDRVRGRRGFARLRPRPAPSRRRWRDR